MCKQQRLLTSAVLPLLAVLSAYPAMADPASGHSHLSAQTNSPAPVKGGSSAREVTGIVNSFDGNTLDLRLANGTCQSYRVESGALGSVKPRKGALVSLATDANQVVTRIQQPEVRETIDGVVTKIANDQVTVRLPNGETRTTTVEPATAARLKLAPGVPIATTFYRGTSLTRICTRALPVAATPAAAVPVVAPPPAPLPEAPPPPVRALW